MIRSKETRRVVGFWSGHDCSFCVFEDGFPKLHVEYERHLREKEPPGDSVDLFVKMCGLDDDARFISVAPKKKLSQYQSSYQKISNKIDFIGHHQAHAAHAFFSSNFDHALVVTLDGGGVDFDDAGNEVETASTIWLGTNNKIVHIKTIPLQEMNIGGLWTRITRYVFGLQSGWPKGHQAGTVMAMAAFGDKSKYHEDFVRMLTFDLGAASFKPPNQPKGACVPGKDPVHPYLYRWTRLAQQNEQERFDLAAGLQSATEELVISFIGKIKEQLSLGDDIPICLGGGVALNSVMVGKLQNICEHVYVPPVPYDGGLCLGAAQYMWHHLLDAPRICWRDNFSPYLGFSYDSSILKTLVTFNDRIVVESVTDETVITLLEKQAIIALYHGASESGRRALGHRSIVADPRSAEMKGKINEKVKHRQWFRPFAPSLLREDVGYWFGVDIDSPYMSFVATFKPEKRLLVPAAVHHDGTARLQTVSQQLSPWYHSFLNLWKQHTGISVLLNTSFNDTEPICETPEHAIKCFLNTEIDYLYFVDTKQLVRKI